MEDAGVEEDLDTRNNGSVANKMAWSDTKNNMLIDGAALGEGNQAPWF